VEYLFKENDLSTTRNSSPNQETRRPQNNSLGVVEIDPVVSIPAVGGWSPLDRRGRLHLVRQGVKLAVEIGKFHCRGCLASKAYERWRLSKLQTSDVLQTIRVNRALWEILKAYE